MRVAVVSDVHSNVVALDAVLAAVGSVDGVWHLGDVVGYGPEPDAVVERLRAVGAVGVRGNHDTATAIDPRLLDWFNSEARAAAEWTASTITPATRDWLAALPDRRLADGISMVHGSPRDPLWEYIASLSVARDNLAALGEVGATVGFHGHTHVPIALHADGDRVVAIRPNDGDEVALGDGPILVNPGSVGQPRDGNPKASWLVFDSAGRTCTWHRTAYDIAAVQGAMRAVNLPPRLAARLSDGL